MNKQNGRIFVPAVLIGLAFFFAFLDLFSWSTVSMVSLIATVAITLMWRRLIFTKLSPDYEVRFKAATDAVRLGATRWCALIFALTYIVLILACGLSYFLGGSWSTFALIVLFVGIGSKMPLCVIVTDLELHRIDTLPEKI